MACSIVTGTLQVLQRLTGRQRSLDVGDPATMIAMTPLIDVDLDLSAGDCRQPAEQSSAVDDLGPTC